ncbi:glycerophosphodiester phosphodiesterase family protein [Klugiella xanthotipulae]|uniref:glycerophosphodiester phosphodiesterase family protein n=1 Tax=Klugiella xanthotipulae TaxID=244735 RepID=UPI0014777585|nr:glycerophosphodiester phosphodiesterase family protein [Klugiella xanthotipulae]
MTLPRAVGHSRFFSGGRPRVFAHRGFAVDVAENSLPAFRAAQLVGVTHIESDVRATSDGVAVLLHDSTFRYVRRSPIHDPERVVYGVAHIAHTTSDQLANMPLAPGVYVPTLEAALRFFPEMYFNLDIKDARASRASAKAILATTSEDRVLITSFSRRRKHRARHRLRVVLGASRGEAIWALLLARLNATPLLWMATSGYHALQIPEHVGRWPLLNEQIVDRLHRAGVEVHVWTVNTRETMTRLMGMGVDGIVTDRADIACDLVKKRPPSSSAGSSVTE